MDKNFLKSASLAKGKYVWFFGQDDLMKDGTIKKIYQVLENDEIGILYLNYSQHDHNMKNVITKSYLDTYSKLDKNIHLKESYYFSNYSNYFDVFHDLPSFLPATIIKGEFWHNTDLDPFFGTNYIQVALMYLNLNKGGIYVLTEPLIKGRIPNNKWQNDGTRHFEVLTGFLKMQKTALLLKECNLPEKVFFKQKRRYLFNYFFHIRLCKTRGFKPSRSHFELLSFVYGKSLTYYIYLLPLTYLPLFVLNFTNAFLYPIKKISKVFLIF